MSASFPGVSVTHLVEQTGVFDAAYRRELEDVLDLDWRGRVRQTLEDAVSAHTALEEESHAHLGEHIGAVAGLVVHAETGPHSVIERTLQCWNSLGQPILRVGSSDRRSPSPQRRV
jgi:hypothetical protein